MGDALSPDVSYRDGYVVKISTTGTLTTDFSTTLLTVPAEEATAWSTRGINLNSYAGQVVRIAFINNSNDMFLLLLDNINVIIPAPMDGKLASLTGFSRYNANTSVMGVFQNNGYTIANNATMNYILNNSPVVTQTMTFSSGLGFGAANNFTFTGSAAFTPGQNTLKVWVSHVNGVAETIRTNDTISTTFFHASQSTLRNALLEDFTSSTCPPCAQLNATFDPILNANTPNSGGRVNAIKNQVNWPSPGNDPSYNPHVKDRVTYYGITGAPTALMNGHDILSHDQAGIDAGKLEPAFANITATLTEVGGVINGMASITPFVTVSNPSQLTVHQVLLQGSYNYPGASTSQKNYYHVMRKMFPSATGSLVATVDGTPINVAFTHSATITATTPLPGSYDFWKSTSLVFEYVVFIEDTVTKDILQSGSAKVNSTIGLVELKDNQTIGIYPSPANDFAVVGIKLNTASMVDVTIYDMTGKVVYSTNSTKVDAGQQELKINTSSFATGTYNVIVKTDSGTLTEKLTVIK